MREETERKTPVTTLGPLETRLMDAAWTAGRSLSVQDVVDRLGGANYKTVMTVLNRLVREGDADPRTRWARLPLSPNTWQGRVPARRR